MFVLTTGLPAQRLHGTIRDSVSQRAVPGVVLLQLDSAGRTLARSISGARGDYSFSRQRAARWLRAQRIGFLPRTVALPGGTGELAVDLALSSLPRFLEPTRVVASGCPRRDDTGIALALLEQARAGLLAAVVSREKAPAALTRLTFERRLQGEEERVLAQEVRIDSAARTSRSFVAARSGADLARIGFLEERGGESILHGPDADVLLDDDFIGAYCFHLARPQAARATQIGLAFAPARRLKDRIDIEGTLWVDTIARSLSDIEFRYRGLDPRIEAFGPGGRVAFREVGDGMVLIDQWSLRLVGTSLDTVRAPLGRLATARPEVRTRFNLSESGGEVAAARWPGGHAWEAPLGAVEFSLRDAQGRAAPGARVRLAGTDYAGTTDSAGRVRLGWLLPGPYAVVVEDSLLARIGVVIDAKVRFTAVRDSLHSVSLQLPTAEDHVGERCEGPRFFEGDSVPWVAGRVVDGDDRPVVDVRVVIRRELGDGNWRPVDDDYRTGSDGLFWICAKQLRLGMPVRLEVRRGSAALESVERTLDATLSVVPIKLGSPSPDSLD